VASNIMGYKKSRFSTKNILLYLWNNTTQGHTYCGIRSIKYFQWSWVTCNPDFNVTPLLDAENVGNNITRYSSYDWIPIGTLMFPKIDDANSRMLIKQSVKFICNIVNELWPWLLVFCWLSIRHRNTTTPTGAWRGHAVHACRTNM